MELPNGLSPLLIEVRVEIHLSYLSVLRFKGSGLSAFNIALCYLESSRSLHVRFVLYRAYKVSIISQRPASLTPNGFLLNRPTEHTNNFGRSCQARLYQIHQILPILYRCQILRCNPYQDYQCDLLKHLSVLQL